MQQIEKNVENGKQKEMTRDEKRPRRRHRY
jgi:hypothetical protein